MAGINNVKAISEVNKILNQMEENSIKKIPKDILDEFAKRATYNVDYIKADIALEELNLERETKEILAVLSYNYFCNDEEKKEWNKIINDNEKSYQEKLRKTYDINNIFDNKSKDVKNIDNEMIENNEIIIKSLDNETVEYQEIIKKDSNNKITEYKETFLKKILNKIRKYFNRGHKDE